MTPTSVGQQWNKALAIGDPAHLLDECLSRIEQTEPSVEAWTRVHTADHLRQIVNLTSSTSRLSGLPLGVKDIFDTADVPTEYGSKLYRGHQPHRDATAVALLRRAGAVIVGKTQTAEFAYAHPAVTRNPWNGNHTPGGSSSGSAAAVAAGMVPVALGTQTAGSIIRPAAYCGVVGYKPTFGTIDRTGVLTFAPSLDTIGVLANSVSLCATVAQVIARDTINFTPPSVHDVVHLRTDLGDEASPGAKLGLHVALNAMDRLNHPVREVWLPTSLLKVNKAHDVIMGWEAAGSFAHEVNSRFVGVSGELRELLERGLTTTPGAYSDAVVVRDSLRSWFRDEFSNTSTMLMPSVPHEAPAGTQSTGPSTMNRLWSLLGFPAVHLPTTLSGSGLPVGCQIASLPHHDGSALHVAASLEEVVGWGNELTQQHR